MADRTKFVAGGGPAARQTCGRAVAVTVAAGLVGAGLAVVGGGPAQAAALPAPVRVNAGGTAFAGGSGQAWAADAWYTGGTTSTTTNAIAGTTDDALFQKRRYGMSGYDIPVAAAGTYRVTMLTAETYWSAKGQRVFSATVEGSPLVTNLDLFATVGRNVAYSVSKDVHVTDGKASLRFSAGVDNAVVSAIEVTALSLDATTPPPPPPPPPPAPSAGSIPIRSGLPWASGVYNPGSNKADADGFGAWRGRPVDVVVDWPSRSSWNDIVNPSWIYDAWAGTPYTKVLGVAPIPEGDSSATLATCASGAYNDKWRQFATNIKARGLDSTTVVRLGWEFNGNWYKWSAYSPSAFAGCWRQIVTSAESVAPALRWDWNVNRGTGQSVADPRQAYPGDAYVDFVGVDSYDGWPGATDEATWNQHLNGAYGLQFWLDFATAHGKRLSVPEWGVYPGTAWAGHNGGDNPFYIQKMVGFFRANADRIAYESYFNEDLSYYAGSLWNPVQAPKASAAYNALY